MKPFCILAVSLCAASMAVLAIHLVHPQSSAKRKPVIQQMSPEQASYARDCMTIYNIHIDADGGIVTGGWMDIGNAGDQTLNKLIIRIDFWDHQGNLRFTEICSVLKPGEKLGPAELLSERSFKFSQIPPGFRPSAVTAAVKYLWFDGQ